MSKRFRDNFKNVYVLDFEFANIGGAMYPTSLAVKNLNKTEEPTKFTWLRIKDGSVKKETKEEYESIASAYRRIKR